MITLHHCLNARSFRPLWVMEEIGLPYQRIRPIVRERHVAYQPRPVMLDLFGCRLGTRNARCRWNNSGVGIEAFEIECHRTLRPIELRIATSARCSDNDIGKVGRVASVHRVSQAEPGCRIRHAEAGVKQSFAVTAAIVCKPRRIAVVRLNADVHPPGNGRILAVIETVVHPARRYIISVPRKLLGRNRRRCSAN